MLISLTTVLATLSSIFRSRAALELENLALRHQIGVLQRSARKRGWSCTRKYAVVRKNSIQLPSDLFALLSVAEEVQEASRLAKKYF
jgi:hypothetical protein